MLLVEYINIYSDTNILDAKFIKGGTSSLSSVFSKKAKDYGVEIKNNSEVIKINCNNGNCDGVTLADGKIFFSKNIISGLDQENTCIKLLETKNLYPNVRTQLNNIKYRGSTARLHFALKSLPKIKGINDDQLQTVFSISPSINYLEKAYDEVKYGGFSSSPYIEFCIPSIINPSFAKDNNHVLSASIQYIPYALKNNKWSDKLKKDIINNVTSILDKYITNFSNDIIDSSISTPLDFESTLNNTEGSFNHGEMTLDQFLFMRPTISSSQYTSTVPAIEVISVSAHTKM